MKIFLQNLVSGLKKYSKSLDKKAILIDKPWALIDSEFEIQKLIFKKNKELIMSKDGQVIIGSWDYLPEAKSLLIDRGKDKILCNEGFIDENVLILKMDGTTNNFFILANENTIPDLDAYSYLIKLRHINLNIVTKRMINGETLEIICENENNLVEVGNQVTIEADNVKDGIYKIEGSIEKYLIKNNRINTIIFEKKYKTKDGLSIMIEQSSPVFYSVGENVYIDEYKAEDGLYIIKWRMNIIVKNGKIVRKTFFR